MAMPEENIEISLQQAEDTLREWKRKKSVIQVYFTDSLSNKIGVYGCVEEIETGHSVRIDARFTTNKPGSDIGLTIRLSRAICAFGEWPERSGTQQGEHMLKYEAFMILKYENGSYCELYAMNL